LINAWGLIAYSAIRSAILGAFSNPRALSGRSKSLTSKPQSDFACLMMNKCLAIVSPLYLFLTYRYIATAVPKTIKSAFSIVPLSIYGGNRGARYNFLIIVNRRG